MLPILLLSLSGASDAASWPRIQTYPQVNANPLTANGAVTHTVSVTVSDDDGYSDINEVRVLFRYTEAGGDPAKGRGYMAWGLSDSAITRFGGTWGLANASGGGRWGYMMDSWGGTTYMLPISCSTTTSGTASGGTGTRTVTWSFRAKAAWAANPLVNDADAWAGDLAGNVIGWRDNPSEFYVISQPVTAYTPNPGAPVVSNPTATSLDVAISPTGSDTDLYCIKINPPVLGKDFVQADGTVGSTSVMRTRAEWGTTTVSGLASGTTYSFKALALRNQPGWSPSQYSSTVAGTTATLVHTIDYAATSSAIGKGVAGMDAQPKVLSASRQNDVLATSFNTSMRYGGDGYNWKTRTAEWNSGTQSTLQRLREARDRNSYLQMCTNTRGIGTGNGSTWAYTDQTPETLAALTADWVFYCNKLVPAKRQGDALDAREQALVDSLSWSADDKLLQPGEALPPKVVYWEIGNEPEGPFPPPSLTPEDYANRYKIISQAVLAEDPTIKVGPGCMSADNGNAWLDAVFSDPANRVDFVAYHPYGPLYWTTKSTSGGVLNSDDLNSSLNWIRQQQIDRRQKMIDRLVANGRPADTPLIASEFNPSSWEGTYYFGLNRTVAHALGLAETVFTYAELGMLAAQYWDLPNNGGSATIKVPGHKVFQALQAYMGDWLLDSFGEPDFRLYTTLDSATGRLAVWAINFCEYRDKPARFQIPGSVSGVKITRHTLAAVSGQTSLIAKNNSGDPTENVTWAVTDLTGTVNPADFTQTFPRATLTLLIFERHLKSLPDGSHVSISGKSVTAVYPSEGYLYVEEDDRSYGIRVAGNCSGISIGDRVSFAGTISTLKPDGLTPSERCISAATIERVSSGTPPEPIGMICRSVGGGSTATTAGVRDGSGASNIGLLVKIAGNITSVLDGERMYVDDGSGVADVDGKVGVLVRCPDTNAFSVGDMVTVTGVVEGSVPQGWDANRRYVRARTSGDVTRVP